MNDRTVSVISHTALQGEQEEKGGEKEGDTGA